MGSSSRIEFTLLPARKRYFNAGDYLDHHTGRLGLIEEGVAKGGADEDYDVDDEDDEDDNDGDDGDSGGRRHGKGWCWLIRAPFLDPSHLLTP